MITNLHQIQSMVDIETLSTKENALILSIGAVKFSLDNGIIDTFYVNLDPKTGKEYGRNIMKETIEWWDKQDIKAKKAVFVDAVDYKEGLESFIDWYGTKSIPIWANSPYFDVKIIDSSLTAIGCEKYPWKYWDVLDFRTVLQLFGLDMRDLKRDTIKHNALDDAKFQAEQLIKILKD